jgi:hypothetical protein
MWYWFIRITFIQKLRRWHTQEMKPQSQLDTKALWTTRIRLFITSGKISKAIEGLCLVISLTSLSRPKTVNYEDGDVTHKPRVALALLFSLYANAIRHGNKQTQGNVSFSISSCTIVRALVKTAMNIRVYRRVIFLNCSKAVSFWRSVALYGGSY